MFKSENDLQITKKELSCVWIRVNENPGAPLVCIWTDEKMRAFEEPETVTSRPISNRDPQKRAPATGYVH
jgi:hypothetical protein